MKTYSKIMQMNIQNSIAYRTEFFMKMMSGIVPLVVQIFIWINVFDVSSNSSIQGYTLQGILFYSLLAVIFTRLTRSTSQFSIANEIKEGLLNQYLSKPINHTFYWFSREIGSKIFYGFSLILIFSVVLFLYSQIPLTVFKAISGLVALLFGIIINFMIYYIISMLAFWFIEISQIFAACDLIIIFLSGGILPIDFFPEVIQEVMQILPFQYIIFFPAKIFSTEISLSTLWTNIGYQAFWILILFPVALLTWAKGIKQYSAFGG